MGSFGKVATSLEGGELWSVDPGVPMSGMISII